MCLKIFIKSFKLFLKILIAAVFCFILLEFAYRGTEIGLAKIQKIFSSKEEVFNLCIVGGSTSVGVPFEERISIPQLISYAFDDSINQIPIKVHNLASSGSNVCFAYWEFRYFVGKQNHPGILLLYSGINDSFDESSDSKFWIWKILRKSLVLRKTLYIIDPDENSFEQYKFHYEAIIQLALAHHWKIITSTLVGNFSEFDPNVKGNESWITSDTFLSAIELEQQTHYEAALLKIKTLHRHGHPYLLYKTARLSNLTANSDSALKYFNLAVDKDRSIRPASYKNNFIKTISAKYNLTCIDPFDHFLKNTINTMPGYDLFVDAHHPNMKGYCFISQLFAEALSKIEKVELKKEIRLSKIENEFKLDSVFYGNAFRKTGHWHIFESLSTALPADRHKKADVFLSLAMQLNPKDSLAPFLQSINFILREDYISLEAMNLQTINFEMYRYIWKSYEGKQIRSKFDAMYNDERGSKAFYKRYINSI